MRRDFGLDFTDTRAFPKDSMNIDHIDHRACGLLGAQPLESLLHIFDKLAVILEHPVSCFKTFINPMFMKENTPFDLKCPHIYILLPSQFVVAFVGVHLV